MLYVFLKNYCEISGKICCFFYFNKKEVLDIVSIVRFIVCGIFNILVIFVYFLLLIICEDESVIWVSY